MENSKAVQFLVLFSAFAIMLLFALDIRNDYFFHFTKQETYATIESLSRVKGNKPYLLTINYSDRETGIQNICTMKVDGRYGKKLDESSKHSIPIAYTKKAPCNVYIIDYKHPTLGSFVLHVFMFLFALLGTILIVRNILKNNKTT